MDESKPTALAPPGAGLPALELVVARMIFRIRRVLGNRASFVAHFQRERRTIHGLVDSCAMALRGRRILIRRLAGMEDSSRDWSVWMTLEHLRITNDAFARVIGGLLGGRPPEGKASTADVKPGSDVTDAVEPAFERSCETVLQSASTPGDLRTPVRFGHPWFGLMDAFSWLALTGTHMGIHRRQMVRIIAGLPR